MNLEQANETCTMDQKNQMNLEFRCTHKDDSELDEIRVWFDQDDTSESSKQNAHTKDQRCKQNRL